MLRAAGLAGAAAVLPLTGCGAGANPSKQDGVTTLRFMQNKPEVVDYFNQVIKDFEALNPDIRVIQDFNEGNFVPGLVRNDPPDVVTRGFAQATADFVKKGIFADLAGLHHQPGDAGAHQLLGPVQRQRDQRPAVLGGCGRSHLQPGHL